MKEPAHPIDKTAGYTEDAKFENGNYYCICCECGVMFTGHKRRVICKPCRDRENPKGGDKCQPG